MWWRWLMDNWLLISNEESGRDLTALVATALKLQCLRSFGQGGKQVAKHRPWTWADLAWPQKQQLESWGILHWEAVDQQLRRAGGYSYAALSKGNKDALSAQENERVSGCQLGQAGNSILSSNMKKGGSREKLSRISAELPPIISPGTELGKPRDSWIWFWGDVKGKKKRYYWYFDSKRNTKGNDGLLFYRSRQPNDKGHQRGWDSPGLLCFSLYWKGLPQTSKSVVAAFRRVR